jgi:hypothetical protein
MRDWRIPKMPFDTGLRGQTGLTVVENVRTGEASSVTGFNSRCGISEHGNYERHLRGFRQCLATALVEMTHAVTSSFSCGCRLMQPQGGYMLWVQMPESVDALRPHRRAFAEGISIAPELYFRQVEIQKFRTPELWPR